MIQQIMEDVLPFLVILFVALFGFAMVSRGRTHTSP